MKQEFKTVTVFLNRSCPRNCVQCGISDNSRPAMSLEEWKRTFLTLKEEFNTEFFLILGTEPLLLKDDLVELVRWFKKHNLFYGFYSTSPPKLFDLYKDRLIEAGLNNWSCGIDAIPGMVPSDPITIKKSQEGLEGLRWMAERGVQTFTVTTVTNENLAYVPKMLEYIQNIIPGVISCINPVEWAHNSQFDFFSEKKDMENCIIPISRRDEVIDMVQEVLKLTRVPGYQIQNPDSHLLEFPRYYHCLDYVCNGIVGIGVDCDGTFRLCGYSRGRNVADYKVKDLKANRQDIWMAWREDAQKCKGCHWSYVQVLQEAFSALYADSSFYRNRHLQPIPNVRKYLKNLK